MRLTKKHQCNQLVMVHVLVYWSMALLLLYNAGVAVVVPLVRRFVFHVTAVDLYLIGVEEC